MFARPAVPAGCAGTWNVRTHVPANVPAHVRAGCAGTCTLQGAKAAIA